MAANVANLVEAMAAAGYETNKALAEASGVSAAAVGMILKRGTCNPSTAEALQAACGQYRIGPYMQLETEDIIEERADSLGIEDVAYEGRPWFAEHVDEHLIITGQRYDEYGVIVWGATVYDAAGREMAETSYDYHSYIPAQGDARALVKELTARGS